MNENAKTILTILSEYLEKNPCIRFTQALANLGINELNLKNTEVILPSKPKQTGPLYNAQGQPLSSTDFQK